LVFAQEVLALGKPTVVALNMLDLAERDGLVLDPAVLAQELGVAVIPTVAVRHRGLAELAEAIAGAKMRQPGPGVTDLTLTERRVAAHAMADAAILSETSRRRVHIRLDTVLLHPWIGPMILLVLLFVMFQAVFAWAAPFADALEGAVLWISGG